MLNSFWYIATVADPVILVEQAFLIEDGFSSHEQKNCPTSSLDEVHCNSKLVSAPPFQLNQNTQKWSGNRKL